MRFVERYYAANWYLAQWFFNTLLNNWRIRFLSCFLLWLTSFNSIVLTTTSIRKCAKLWDRYLSNLKFCLPLISLPLIFVPLIFVILYWEILIPLIFTTLWKFEIAAIDYKFINRSRLVNKISETYLLLKIFTLLMSIKVDEMCYAWVSFLPVKLEAKDRRKCPNEAGVCRCLRSVCYHQNRLFARDIESILCCGSRSKGDFADIF